MKQLVIGLGQIGAPLLDVLTMGHDDMVLGRDIAEPPGIPNQFDVLHICYPYKGAAIFEWLTLDYIAQYSPALCIVHSTVAVGTTEAIGEQATCQVAYSPVRGRHGEMRRALLRYSKFVSSPDPEAALSAGRIFEDCGMQVAYMVPVEALELAKLLSTTYSALLLAWAQEMSRFCYEAEANYWHVMAFMAERANLPPVAWQPGHIGGHCLMQNLPLLGQLRASPFIEVISESNSAWGEPDEPERLRPRPMTCVLKRGQNGC